MWELLAFSLRYPDAELAEAVAGGEWADAAHEVADALGLDAVPCRSEGAAEGPARLRSESDAEAPAPGHPERGAETPSLCHPEQSAATPVPCRPERSAAGAESKDLPQPGALAGDRVPDALLRSLRAEATRLFVGAPDAACSPYEGVWRAADDGVQALLFVNPHSMEVERFARACGLGRPEGTSEPLDHAATECELLQHLAMLEAGIAAPPEGMDPADLPGGSPAAAYASFLEEHARVWMPRFADRLAAESREPFYRAAAQLLSAAVR
ncbi:molecular chaperone TorD family protein [Gordonibacter massiliensis]|uniref:Molecular chaperone TorD family protein n=2 Tax=Gordonibacter massiliensis (ex Traore et al. 2017) TaxID=1841863 RepID=A0A842JJ51_9ACTN|nr:molecular chaperone TorD family protein [Gordonibacter massiliensis (ex Traore et al. 2017)]